MSAPTTYPKGLPALSQDQALAALDTVAALPASFPDRFAVRLVARRAQAEATRIRSNGGRDRSVVLALLREANLAVRV